MKEISDDPTVFVVEDEPSVRQAGRTMAETMGLNVHKFDNAKDFLGNFDRQAKGCIVTDVRLPGMSGVELLEELCKNGRKIPMVVITGYATTSTVVWAKRDRDGLGQAI